ncbi:hypothetical protein V5O48_017564 [Marasmius crinis-equi]|uniref:Uncharacterized protein n=1 Tax=Marasmius crinis-equi TaxID=585013 RepID=A0ABR3ENR3_9AGAR
MSRSTHGSKVTNKEACRRYRSLNREDLNRKAKERMAKRRKGLSDDKKAIALQEHCMQQHSYYERNREAILEKAEQVRLRKYIQKSGKEQFDWGYKTRIVKPRALLGMNKNSPEYKAGLEKWKADVELERERVAEIEAHWRGREY